MDHSSNKVASKRPLVELQDADFYKFGGGASSLILRQVAIMEEEAKPSCSSKRLHMDSFHEIPSNLLKSSLPSSAPTPLILQGSLITKLDEDKTSLESQITKLDDGKASLESVLQKHDEAAATSRSEVKNNTDCSYNLPGNQGLEELIINFDDLQNGAAGADQNYGSGAGHGHLQVNLADCLLDQSAWDDDGMGDLLSALSNFNEGSNPVVHSSYLIGNDEGDNCCLSDNPNYGDNCIRLWNEVPELPDWMTLSTVAANLDNL